MPRWKNKKGEKRLHTSTVRALGVGFVVALFTLMITYSMAYGIKMDRTDAIASTDVFAKVNLKGLDDKPFTSENLKDAQITLFNVWGTTCAPCIIEMPDLEELNHSYEPGKIQVVGVLDDSLNDDGTLPKAVAGEAQEIIEKTGVTYPTLVPDETMSAFLNATIVGTPTTFFVDSNGKILLTLTGAHSLESMKEYVDQAFTVLNEQG